MGSCETHGRENCTTCIPIEMKDKQEALPRKPVRCVLYKSVGGVYTADPKIIPEARLIPEITYEEMMEMGSQGAKVVHPRAVEIAQHYGVEILITRMGD